MALADRIAALTGDDDPKKKPVPSVTAGPITPVGVPVSEVDRLANAPDLKTRIAARLALVHSPSGYYTQGSVSAADKLASGAKEMVTAPLKSALVSTLGALDRGTFNQDDSAPSVIPDKEYHEATAQTAANAFAPAMGHVIGGAAIGAAYDPEHPLRGALIGGTLGKLTKTLSGEEGVFAPKGRPSPGQGDLPAGLETPRGPLPAPSNAARAVRTQVDAAAKAGRPVPPLKARIQAVAPEPITEPFPVLQETRYADDAGKHYGVVPEVTHILPSELTPLNEDEIAFAEANMKAGRLLDQDAGFRKKAGVSPEEWARSIDINDPIDATIYRSGKIEIADGHHRWLAAKMRGEPVAVRLKAINTRNPDLREAIDRINAGVEPYRSAVISPERWDATDHTGRLIATGGGERFSGLPLGTNARQAIRTGYRSAVVTPYAEIEQAHPELANALLDAGAASKRAEHIADRRLAWVHEGLTPDQQRLFGQKLVHDNLLAEADRKATAADRLDEQAIPETPKNVVPIRDTNGKLRRNLADVPHEDLQAEWQRLAEQNGMDEGLHSSVQESGYRESYNALPKTEKFGRKGQEDLPDADGMVDGETLAAHNKIVSDYNRNTVARQARARAMQRIEKEMARRESATDFNFGANVETEPAAAVPDNAATLRAAAARFQAHADALAPHVAGVEQEPWFQSALDRYKTHIEGPLTESALAAGVDPASLRQPTSAYVRLASEARLNDAEIRRALDVAGVKDASELQRRPELLRKLIGENPALRQYFAKHANGPRLGPLAKDAGYPGDVAPVGGKRTQATGSANMAQGTAAEYATDLARIINMDARDKAVKSARNKVWTAVSKVGRQLEEGEAPTPGQAVLSFTDAKGLATGDTGPLRYEVSPEVAAAVNKFHAGSQPQSAGFRGVKKATDLATRAQISGMPVEATSHANTLASIIASVPGEKDVTGKVLSAVPMLGGKAAAIREMMQTDFSDPAVRALESRLADIGALRIEEPHGGLINSAHRWLFGPEGVDVRGRLALARKLLDRKPNATDAELREFVNTKLGNYIAQNSGALPNFMAKGSVLSPFARFQSARIPTAIQTTLGQSGLPTNGTAQKLGDVAQTLYRGPVGYGLGLAGLNAALSGHSSANNEAGHELDLNTGLVAEGGHIRRQRPDDEGNPEVARLYIPAATLNPVAYAGLRATGLRSALSPGTPKNGKVAGAVRDMANVALGTVGPAVRMAQTAVTGTQPYLQRDNTLLRVAPHEFSANAELAGQVKTALGLANPAVAALTSAGGDASRKLSGVLAEDGRAFGGPASLAARIAEFTLPRVISPSIGGTTNEQSADRQEARRYDDAVLDLKRRIKEAPGPVARQAIIDKARDDALRAGFDPDRVEVALQKAVDQDQTAVREQQQKAVAKKLEKIRQ